MKNISKFVIAVFISFLMTNLLYAARPGLYIGVGAARSKLETSSQTLFDDVNVKAISNSTKSGGFGSRVFVGFNLNCYFGLEAGYARYAKSKHNGNATDVNGVPANASTNYSLYAYDLVGKGYLPIWSTGLNIYVLGGVARATNILDKNLKVDQSPPQNTSPTTTKYRPIYGAGVSYDFHFSGFMTNLEVTRIQGWGDVNTSTTAIPTANMVTLNVAYCF